MAKALTILGAIMLVVGAVWIGQGLGYIGGSFMTGQRQWSWIGAVTAALGVATLLWANLRK